MKQLFNLVAFALLLSGCSHGSSDLWKKVSENDKKIVLQSDFNDAGSWLKIFEPDRTAPWTSGMDRSHIIFDPDKNHNVLEIKYPKGEPWSGARWLPVDQLSS